MSVLTSPSLSTSSLGSAESFDMADMRSDVSALVSNYDSDDEIVYLSSLSSSRISQDGMSSPSAASDDFVVLSRPLSPVSQFSRMSISTESDSAHSDNVSSDPPRGTLRTVDVTSATPMASSVRLPPQLGPQDYPSPAPTPRPSQPQAAPSGHPAAAIKPGAKAMPGSPRLACAMQRAEKEKLAAQQAVDAAIAVFERLQRAAALAKANTKGSSDAELLTHAKALNEQALRALVPLTEARKKLTGVTNTLKSLMRDHQRSSQKKAGKKAATPAKAGKKLVGGLPQPKSAKKPAKKAATKKAPAAPKATPPKSKVVRGPVSDLQYQEAATFISTFLANPAAAQDKVCRLTLLQSLLVEFGVTASDLPTSLTAAKAAVKSTIFVNIKEYLATRDQGPEALRKLLHPNRASLVREIRKKKNPASLKGVKQQGLQALLVQCF